MYTKSLTRIHQIELSSRCNLACAYCPHSGLERDKADMTWNTFHRALDWIRYFKENGDQSEISLTGMGEALLNPRFRKMVVALRHIIPTELVLFATNGILFNEETAEFCGIYNIQVCISLHRPEVAKPAIDLAREYNVLMATNDQFATSAFDWAGQVDWQNSAPALPCQYLEQGWGVVLQNGDITSCCFDAHGKHVISNIRSHPPEAAVRSSGLCDSCTLLTPEDLGYVDIKTA